MLIAITRAISPAIDRCELSHLKRLPINLERAITQHHAYEEALQSIGIEVHPLPAEPDMPDSVFVEDTAIVLDECAVITRPGADSRKLETKSIVRALTPYRELFTIQTPSTLDGGDVLRIGKTIYVGLSRRSDQSAIEQMQTFLSPFGYTIRGIPVNGCLHLKSATTQIAEDLLIVNSAWVDKSAFPGLKFIEVHPSEPYAANALFVSGTVIYQTVYPKTLCRLKATGIEPLLVNQSELNKAEGALTCCSLIFTA
jgi:dimethylargininase